MTQKANFVGDKYIYSTLTSSYSDFEMSFADKTFTDITKIVNIPDMGITDAATGATFEGPLGVDFSPVITVSSISIKYVLFSISILIHLYQCCFLYIPNPNL